MHSENKQRHTQNMPADIYNNNNNNGHFYGAWSLSPFLIGRMFLREPSWKYSAKLVGS